MVRPRFFDIKLSFSAVAVYWCYIYYSGVRVKQGLLPFPQPLSTD